MLDVKTGQIYPYPLKRYYLLIELLKWLGCNPKNILYGIDGVAKATSTINKWHLSVITST